MDNKLILSNILTLAITWPEGLHATKENHLEAAQVHGIVRPG